MKKRIISLLLMIALFASTMCVFAFSSEVTSESNIKELHKNSLIFGFDEIKEFDGTVDSAIDYSDKLSDWKKSDSFTVLCQFMQTDEPTASLVSISNGNEHAKHFHIYVNGDRLGYEFRNAENDSAAVYTLRPLGINTVAFAANAEDHTFKLYLNGNLVSTKTFTEDTYPRIADIAGLNSILVGATDRSAGGNEYLMIGQIGELSVYGEAFSNEELKKYTSATPSEDGILEAGQPFSHGDDFGISQFRIPCLLTLQNGDVIAVSDLRSSLADSPNNIETGVRILDKETNTWSEALIVNEFDDYEYNYSSRDSASFIDSSVVQLEDGRILMLTDVMPANGGGGIGGKGNGMLMIDGQYCVALTMGDTSQPSKDYEYYLYPNKASTHTYDKYIIRKVSDRSDTGYTTDAKFYVYKDGVAQTVKQQPNNEIDVPMNIFYSRSIYKVYRTSYFYLNYSDDGGYTWSDPILVGSEYRAENENYFNKSPGVGIQIKKGEYAGRIIFPIYSGGQLVTRMMYSDDGGLTWQMGERTALNHKDSPGQASETQVIELPDGTIRMYTRTNTRYVGYADSIDGGHTFNTVIQDYELFYGQDCMISVTNLNEKIDGKDAVAISYPGGTKDATGRVNGIIKIGLINENEGYDAPAYGRYSIEWKYTYEVNQSAFWYSCLADKGDGTLAILYEPGPLVYNEYKISDITEPPAVSEDILESAEVIHSESLSKDNKVTLKLTFNQPIYEKFSKLSDALAYANESNGKAHKLAFSGLENDNKTVCFSGELTPTDTESTAWSFTLAKTNVIVTLDGSIDFSDSSAVATKDIPYSSDDTSDDVSDTTDGGEPTDTTAPDDTTVPAESENDTTEPEINDNTTVPAEDEKGCVSTLSGMGALAIVISMAVAVKRRKEE